MKCLILLTTLSSTFQAFASLSPKTKLTPEKLEAAIGQKGLKRNLWELDIIGKRNNGNRAFGTKGYTASSEYVLSQITTKHDKQFRTWKQPFNHTYEETRKISVLGPDGENVEALSLMYNNATPLPNGVTGELVAVPVDNARGSGCFEDQWTGVNATGKLALVKRGTCAISNKLKIAKSYGALGVILFHNTNSTPNAATLGAENIGLLAPVGVVSLNIGEAWLARIEAKETLTVNLVVDSIFEPRSTWNVFAETLEGDPNNVIMLGAHLDSVQAGPGINDDGSGVTAQIEIIKALRGFRDIKNKVRFAFWGAEEAGLVGSLFYTEHLTPAEADQIRFYFNYDMIGSPVPVYGIYASENPGDKVGAQILLDYLVAKGKPAYFGSFGTGSDYVGFLQLGIPSSGIHTGGGVPADPCYHLACDTYDNISWEALELNTKAAAKATAALALSVEGLPPRNTTSVNPGSARRIRMRFQAWEDVKVEAANAHSCALKTKRTV
ncbi:Zn-dependent exopeptidase [Amniculicola lignicola CBS 123094]|uniref:Peptide hydrolase n=1 Tax=Amniculicola lignicola CBS 123094 TaxID=1392246 RepID=A0A6A5WHK6_9PLEO|nr:Zn-dependent exopeptidase [Amniculicola lignicola CBS 123094]